MPAEQLFTHRVWLWLVGVQRAERPGRGPVGTGALAGFALGKNTPPE